MGMATELRSTESWRVGYTRGGRKQVSACPGELVYTGALEWQRISSALVINRYNLYLTDNLPGYIGFSASTFLAMGAYQSPQNYSVAGSNKGCSQGPPGLFA